METYFTRGKIFLEVKGRSDRTMLVDLDKVDCFWKDAEVTEPFTTIVINGKAYGIIEDYNEILRVFKAWR